MSNEKEDAIYVNHPCTTEQKREILRQHRGRIVDARFAPEGAEVIDPPNLGGDEPAEAAPEAAPTAEQPAQTAQTGGEGQAPEHAAGDPA